MVFGPLEKISQFHVTKIPELIHCGGGTVNQTQNFSDIFLAKKNVIPSVAGSVRPWVRRPPFLKNVSADFSGCRKYFLTKFSQNVHQNTIFICRSLACTFRDRPRFSAFLEAIF